MTSLSDMTAAEDKLGNELDQGLDKEHAVRECEFWTTNVPETRAIGVSDTERVGVALRAQRARSTR